MSNAGDANARRREIGQERRERTRRRLLAAAARVVAEMGENKATIDDFIQAAEVARGTFYNYYTTRDDLIADLWVQVGRNPMQEIQRASATLTDPAERLCAIIRMVLRRAAADPTWGWLVYALSADRDSVNDDLLTYPGPDLLAGRQSGRLQFDDLTTATDLLVGAVRAALRGQLDEGRPPSHGVELCIMLMRALGLDGPEAHRLARQPLPA